MRQKKIWSMVLACSMVMGVMAHVMPEQTWAAETNVNGVHRDMGKADAGEKEITQYMDCFLPMPVIGELNGSCWGAADTGPRDQENGLEDKDMSDYCYWDGTIIKDEETGKYHMFASRWAQKGGHWGSEYDDWRGWTGSQAIHAVSDSLYGPYEDKGPLWPDYYEGAGHNVFAFALSEKDPLYGQYKYAISVSDVGRHGDEVNGTFHLSNRLDGTWTHIGKMDVDTSKFGLSNISIMVRPDGRYEATNRNGDIAVADSIGGRWEVVEQKLWWKVPGMPHENVEDPVIWYSDGLYHCIANKWDARRAYYMTSENGITDWKLHPGTAYTPDVSFLSYEDGTKNSWTKLERPGVYVENGTLTAMTFAVIDVQKEEDMPYDSHGSKVIVVPFAGERLGEFASRKDVLESRTGILPSEDSNIQSWQGERWKNYGGEAFLQLQRNTEQGLFGEGGRPYDDYDCKIGYLKYDLSEFDLKEDGSDIESAYLSLVFMEDMADKDNRASKDRIRVSLSGSGWKEGSGREDTNGNYADSGTLTWDNAPALNYDAGDIRNSVSMSEEFLTEEMQKEITIDVTGLLKRFKEDNAAGNILSFALSNQTADRIHIGSKEAGKKYAARLSVYKKQEKKIASAEKISVETLPGKLPDLPEKINVTFSDGTAGTADVKWEISQKDTESCGEKRISGTILGYGAQAEADVRVKYAAYAGDLAWSATTGNPVKNRTAGGSQLKARTGRLGDPVSYEKGIGTQAGTEVIYDVAGLGYENFRAVIGLGYDYGQDAPGAVVFKVYTDEEQEPAYVSPVMTCETAGIPIDIDIRGASKVRLVTEAAGSEAAKYQVADWCDAKFVSGSPVAERALWENGTFFYIQNGQTPDLPESVNIQLKDGNTAPFYIKWQELAGEMFAEPGIRKITGSVTGIPDTAVSAKVITDFNEAVKIPGAVDKAGNYSICETFPYVLERDGKTALSDIGEIQTDCSLFYQWSSHMMIENCTGHGYGFDYGMYPEPNNGDPEYLVVRAPFMTGFSVRGTAYTVEQAEKNFVFETSADGTNWQPVADYEKTEDASGGDWASRIYRAESLPEGTHYLKITFPFNETWGFNLNEIRLTADGAKEEDPEHPPVGPEQPPADENNKTDPNKTETPRVPANGTVFASGILKYMVTKSDAADGTVTVTELLNKNQTKIVIPETVQKDGITFRVTAIKEKVFQGNKKIKNVTIGANITKIGAKSFFGCKKLKAVVFKGLKAPKAGKQAFAGIKKNCKITVPKEITKKDFKKLKKAVKSAGSKVKFYKKSAKK